MRGGVISRFGEEAVLRFRSFPSEKKKSVVPENPRKIS